MSKKDNRICYACGTPYYYCPSCPSDKKDPKIYTMFHTEKCKNVFECLRDYFFKKISKKNAKEKLISFGVTVDDEFKDSIKAQIKEVFAYEEEKSSYNNYWKKNKHEKKMDIDLNNDDEGMSE